MPAYIVIVSASSGLTARAVEAENEEAAGNAVGGHFIHVYPDEGQDAVLHDPYAGTEDEGNEVPMKVIRDPEGEPQA